MHDQKDIKTLMLGAIGVVYGDIGTSPLYALKETLSSGHSLGLDEARILGVLSLIFWAIMMLVTIKYVTLIMRADNRGEGGSLALLALVSDKLKSSKRRVWIVGVLGIFAAALFYGDSMITPAISVLSAVEGMKIIAPHFGPAVIPTTAAILTGLFWIQKRGTGTVGMWFGPIMCLWFITLAVLGLRQIVTNPAVLFAINPLYAIELIVAHPHETFLGLGAVVLAVTGGEALYTDMGHFGCKPIRMTWFTLVLPALLLNYFGQGALLLNHPEALENPFFLLAPDWLLAPLVVLATLAHRHRVAGGDLGRFFGRAASHPTRLSAAHANRAYLGSCRGSDLCALHQLDAVSGGDGAGGGLSIFQQSGPPPMASP